MTRGDTESPRDEYVPMSEVCRRLSISRSTVYRHGLLKYAIPFGHGWRFNWRDVLKHYAQQGETSRDRQA